jgi:hypothetical protein
MPCIGFNTMAKKAPINKYYDAMTYCPAETAAAFMQLALCGVIMLNNG